VKRLLIIAAGAAEAEALRQGLRYAPGCHVIGFVDISRPCGWTVREAAPDVILLDDAGADEVTLARLREARENAAEATIVCRTAQMDTGWPQTAADAGADATVDAALDSARMGALVREIAAGTVFHAPRPAQSVQDRAAGEELSTLTARELEILGLAASGASNSRIARELWVTEQTVKFHLSNVYRKLGLANRTEAAYYAHRHGLVRLLGEQGAPPVAA
jgi:DNA-binding NarL/FixJ family response regulator